MQREASNPKKTDDDQSVALYLEISRTRSIYAEIIREQTLRLKKIMRELGTIQKHF